MKFIELTQGKQAIVDDDDYERVNAFKWYAIKGKNTYYAQRQNGNRKNKITYHLHKFILNTTELIDHIDGNGLNNQKSNLRICNHKENSYNKRIKENVSSKYKGVYFDKLKKVFVANIKIDYKSNYIGSNKDEIICAKIYDAVIRYHHKEFAKCNFEIETMSLQDAKILMKELHKKK